MITLGYEREIIKELNQLNIKQQQEVLNFIHSLIKSKIRGVKGAELLTFAGAIELEELQLMEKAINDGCEGVDLDEW